MDFEKSESRPLLSSSSSASLAWQRSVKRKVNLAVTDEEMRPTHRTPLSHGIATTPVPLVDADVETLAVQQLTIQGLTEELEEERSASSSAAVEAMSMILRLQREKAEVTMEARQFKLYVEEKMAHDQREIAFLEDAIYKREQMLHAVLGQVRSYRRRLLSYGITSDELGEYDDQGRNNPPPASFKEVSFDRAYTVDEGKEEDEDDMKRLYRRMQSLEEDRELLKNEIGFIAQNLSTPPESEVEKKPWWFFSSFMSVFNMWIGVPLLVKACVVFLYRKQIIRLLFIRSLQQK